MAEGARLESVYAGNRIEGSNPSPSAIIFSFIILAEILKKIINAERVGFEPTLRYKRKHAFQACAFSHSATSP